MFLPSIEAKNVTICSPNSLALWFYADLILIVVTTDHILQSMCDHYKWCFELRLAGRGILKNIFTQKEILSW